MKKELGIRDSRVEGNNVYAYCEHSLIDEIGDEQCNNLDVSHKRVNDSNKKIPKLFMNTKFHKRPYEYRFTVIASKAITKNLTIDVNSCLKLVKMCNRLL